MVPTIEETKNKWMKLVADEFIKEMHDFKQKLIDALDSGQPAFFSSESDAVITKRCATRVYKSLPEDEKANLAYIWKHVPETHVPDFSTI